MLIKIRFAFTGVFLKFQNVIINQVHFNTFGGGLYLGGGGGGASNRMYFLCTGRRAYNWEGAISGESGRGRGGLGSSLRCCANVLFLYLLNMSYNSIVFIHH